MNKDIIIRRANSNDIDFIIKSIIEAEKSGTEIISYCNIFEIPEEELKANLWNIIEEDVEGQELCISGFLIAEIDGIAVGAVCSWVEGDGNLSSSIIKSTLIHYYFSPESQKKAYIKSNLLDNLNIHRKKNTLQIESVFVNNKYRGLGVSNKIINTHINNCKNENNIDKVQIQVMKNNPFAIKAYEKIGFNLKEEKTCSDNEILKILPYNCKIMMEIDLRKV